MATISAEQGSTLHDMPWIRTRWRDIGILFSNDRKTKTGLMRWPKGIHGFSTIHFQPAKAGDRGQASLSGDILLYVRI